MMDFEHSLPMLLLRAREACMTNFRPLLSQHGLTEQQWRVIRALAENNGLESKDLAERTLILKPSMTGIIDRLVRDGLVTRKKDKDDGRKTCIWLTRKASRLYERMMPLVAIKYNDIQKNFSDKKWDVLYDSLFHLIQLNNKSQN
jgi:homoprotocatechuate degradation regulator HpaR